MTQLFSVILFIISDAHISLINLTTTKCMNLKFKIQSSKLMHEYMRTSPL